MSQQLDIAANHADNPLDHVEDVLHAHNWVFNRMNDDELIVEVAGKSCNYRLLFIWQEDMSALQFCCQFDMHIKREKMMAAAKAMLSMNETLWMGHFDLPQDTGIPSFRHTCLFRGMNQGSGAEHIDDLVTIALAQCERYHTVFHLLANAGNHDEGHLSLALMETAGES